jgi:ArsR family transcriptional regulator
MFTFMKAAKAKPKKEIPVEMLERMAQVLKTLAHPHRLRIIEILDTLQEAPVHEIMVQAQLPQSLASQHLNRMRRMGLVGSRRKGKEVWYFIADPESLTILNCARSRLS